MKLLVGFGHATEPNAFEHHYVLWRGLGDEVRIFSNVGGDVLYTPGMDFENIIQELGGFCPEMVILYSPEYWIIPRGLEKFDGIVVALIGDWNLSTVQILAAQHAIDYNFTDKMGVEFLSHWGVRAEYFPMFSYIPEQYDLPPAKEKEYDIVFIGNIHPEIHAERNRLVYRIAQLRNKYKIMLTSNIYGKAYAELMNRSKIVFNKSIRGEMNMRAYEAPGCSSLLFMEEENLEVREFYKDRVHCVLYNEQNLEELLQHYITHDEEREKIIDNARKQVKTLTYAKRINGLLERLRRLPSGKKLRKKLFDVKDAAFFLNSCFVGQAAPQEVSEQPKEAYPLNNHAVIKLAEARRVNAPLEAFRNIETLFMAAHALAPNDPIIPFNLGRHFYYLSDDNQAMIWFLKCAALLKGGHRPDPRSLPVSMPYSDFALRWYKTYRDGPQDLPMRQALLFSEETLFFVGELLARRNDFKGAIAQFRDGLSLNENNGGMLKAMGNALKAEGNLKKAYDFFRRAFELRPLEPTLWKDLLGVLKKLNSEETSTFLDTHLELLSVLPMPESLREELLSIFFDEKN